MERYNLDLVIQKIVLFSYKTIVLQFPDEELSYSISVYEYLENHFNTNILNPTNELIVELYIAADSTWGSSVDDISALHCSNCDVLIYFGTDLSSSGTIPVMIVPPIKTFNIEHCYELISINKEMIDNINDTNLIIFYEPSYYQSCQDLIEYISPITKLNIILSKLPLCADLKHWIPHVMKGDSNNSNREEEDELVIEDIESKQNLISIGGLFILKSLLANHQNKILYIGDKSEQITNIMLRLSQYSILHYSPIRKDIYILKGNQSREFNERYGGVMKVKDAKIIGILIGSMGLTAELTNNILHRLQQLILIANKRYYTFVMGRLNEAKICNFPEIDLFCFISNEDHANIKPKTFPKPIITPYELELGLGSQDWDSIFTTDLSVLVGNGEEDLNKAIIKVKTEYINNNPIDEDDDNDQQSNHQQQHNILDNQIIKACSNELTVFHSPSAEYYKDKQYHGLTYSIDENPEMNIINGLYGIASNYSIYNTQDNISNNNNQENDKNS